jgi:hypothetical protein
LPRKRETERDRIYTEILENRALRNVELADMARKYSLFKDVSPVALNKDISRFVKRELGKTIDRVDGRLRIVPKGELSWRIAYKLLHLQLDIRDHDAKKIIHQRSHKEVLCTSDTPIAEANFYWQSAKPLTWEERNPVIEVKQDDAVKQYDKSKRPRFRPNSNPYDLAFIVDLPKKFYRGQTLDLRYRYSYTDPALNYTYMDLEPTKKFVFDLIKVKTNTESLDCQMCERGTDRGLYLPPPGQGQIVTHLFTDEQVYALHWTFENPKPGMDYRFQYTP